MKKLYIGCALSQAPIEFIEFMETVKAALADHFEILSFVGLTPDATALGVYTTDINCAIQADVMLALADFPSTGLGMEIQERLRQEKTTLIAYHTSRHISRMILGAAEVSPALSTLPYESIDDIVEALSRYV